MYASNIIFKLLLILSMVAFPSAALSSKCGILAVLSHLMDRVMLRQGSLWIT